MTKLQDRVSPAPGGSIPFRVSGALATGSVLQPLNSSMIAVAIVGIATQFGSSAGVSWIISAMYITTAVGAPTAGRMGVLFGARRVFVGGLVLVATGSVAGMLAPSVGWLVAAYVLLGAGISAHMPTAMTMVRSYAQRYERDSRTALAALVMCGQSIAALGPTIGGLLVGTFGWQSILWVNLPVVVFSAVAVSRVDVGFAGLRPPSARGGALRALDLVGIAMFLVAITSLMVLLVSFRGKPMWALLPVTVFSIIAFVWWERRAADPFFDVRALVRNRALANTLVRTMLTYTCFYCVFFGIPQWLQTVRGMSAVEAGLTMLPVAGVSVLSTMVGSRLYRRSGARATLLVGTVALLIGGVLIALVERSTAPVLVLLLVASVLGIPNGFNNIGNQSLVNSVTSVDEVGAAIGMFRTMAFIGANLSVVVLQVAAGGHVDDTGLHRMGWFVVVAAAVLVVSVAVSRHLDRSDAPMRKFDSPQ